MTELPEYCDPVGSKKVVSYPLGSTAFWQVDDHALHKFRDVPPLLQSSGHKHGTAE